MRAEGAHKGNRLNKIVASILNSDKTIFLNRFDWLLFYLLIMFFTFFKDYKLVPRLVII